MGQMRRGNASHGEKSNLVFWRFFGLIFNLDSCARQIVLANRMMSRWLTHVLPTTLGECIYGRPNAYSELPAAIAMYSLPSTSNAIGDAYTAPPI